MSESSSPPREGVNANTLLRHGSFSSLLIWIYMVSLSRTLPPGINHHFVTRSAPWLGALALTLLAGFLVQSWCKHRRIFRWDVSKEPWERRDVLLVLLPMTPIAQYILRNQETLSLFDSLNVFGIFLALTILLVVVVPALFGLLSSRHVMMLMASVLILMLFSNPIIAQQLQWGVRGNAQLELQAFAGACAASYVLAQWSRRALDTLIAIYSFSAIAAALLAIDLAPLRAPSPSALAELTRNRVLEHKPDIFLMTYDSYVENETMRYYAIDNSAQETFLEERGFQIHRGTYSIGSHTTESMNSMLHAPSEMEDIPVGISGKGTVQTLLSENGYEVAGIFPSNYFFLSADPSYDVNYPLRADFGHAPSAPWVSLTKAVLRGAFRYQDTYTSVPRANYLGQKDAYLRAKSDKPRFLYTHSGPGHSQNSGRCLDNEVELFRERLATANSEMRKDILTILETSPDAVIIVNGDHGPYLTGNCYKMSERNADASAISRSLIQDRYGTFLAIRWPDSLRPEQDVEGPEILQDVFPYVFSRLYGDPAIYDTRLRRPVSLLQPWAVIAGVDVRDGVIVGGPDDGKPLFESTGSSK